MKKIIAFAAVLALGACAQENGTDAGQEMAAAGDEDVLEGSAPGFEAVAPGEYEVVHADESVDSLTIHPGMTWSMVFANGDAAGGTIFMQGGETCFVTEGVEGHECFVGGEVAEDGSMDSTASDGEVMTVRPVPAT
ncbi:hypothetical protein [Alteraurantiacibacter aquimixticola]|uniref:Uncharacterized protein n=1 Tax=Alteraurantiacibacter aquimixticola TaxID=2489173 RepID=A0A4T3F1S0_9SPHN|nr:hypothetical protein [Alteraurantiacibacter aquimixticola]TIX49980.1 hypothetical protein E5222_06660 [Alteraurantiacibacter aquimixticola]